MDMRYYDVYSYATNDETYTRRILGDATGEMGPFAPVIYGSQNRQIGSWYAADSNFIHYGDPWFRRGGDFPNGLGSSLFGFSRELGRMHHSDSFRVVLTM